MVMEEPGFGKKCGPYEMQELLGRGSCAQVWLCTSSNIEGQLFAAKFVKKRSLIRRKRPRNKKRRGKYGKARGKTAREIAIMKRLRHDHVLNLFDVLDDPNQNFLVLILEYCAGGTVAGDLARCAALDVRRARSYFQQLLLGLEYLHHHDIFHRDIKPSNLLLSKDKQTLKIADFGVSEFLHEHNDEHSGVRGTVAFLAPEAFGTSAFHAVPVDVWAAGVTLYVMLYGEIPFGLMKHRSSDAKEGSETTENAGDDDEKDRNDDDRDGTPTASTSSFLYEQTSPEEIRRQIRRCRVTYPHRRYAQAERLLSRVFVLFPEKRARLEDLKRDAWLRGGSWANDRVPDLSDDDKRPINVTNDEVRDAVISYVDARRSSGSFGGGERRIRHLVSTKTLTEMVKIESKDGTSDPDAHTATDIDTKNHPRRSVAEVDNRKKTWNAPEGKRPSPPRDDNSTLRSEGRQTTDTVTATHSNGS